MSAAAEIINKSIGRLCVIYPVLIQQLKMLKLEEAPDIETMGVDATWNLAFNPEFVLNHEGVIDFLVMHELSHLLLDHHTRMSRLVRNCDYPSEQDPNLANIAGDFEINSMLSDSSAWGLLSKVPVDGCFPTREGFDVLRSLEFYWRKLKTASHEYGGGKASKLEMLMKRESESLKDGPQEMEERRAAKEKDAAKGQTSEQKIEAFEESQKRHEEIKNAERELATHAMGAGTRVPEAIYEWARSKVLELGLWKKQLRSFVGDIVTGAQNRTYAKPARRPAIGNLVNPKTFNNTPEITVIVDVSGSMEILAKNAMGVLEDVLVTFKKINLVTCDDEIHLDKKIHSASHLKDVRWNGGGTYMSRAIDLVNSRKLPDGVIMITDGETNWPDYPFFKKTPFLILLTRPIDASKLNDWDFKSRIPKNATIIDIPVLTNSDY